MASETKTVEKPEVDAYIDELRGRMARKQELREKNLTAEQHRPDESFFRKLDSNLKKNTAFIKKLKTLTESQRTALINDFGALNLTKYVEEMASSLVEVKLKVTDVPCAIELCCLAHQRYARFADVMLEQWRKALPQKKTDKVTNASKLRVDLRMFGELVVLGLFVEKDGLQVLGNALAFLIQTDKTEHQNAAVLTTFIRYCGEDYAGLAPRSIRMAADRLGLTLPKSTIFSAERRQTVGNLLAEYYDSLVKHVLNDHSEKKIQERRNRRQYDTKGEVQPDARQRLEEMRANFEKLLQSAQQMAEYLDKDPPAVPDDQPDEDDLLMDENGVVIQIDATFRDGRLIGSSLWEDEDTRQFYETLPELRVMLPGILFKDSEEATLAPVVEKIQDEKLEELIAEEAGGEQSAEGKEAENTADSTADNAADSAADSTAADADDDAAVLPPEADDDVDDSGHVSGSTLKLLMQAFVDQLPKLVNRDLIDHAAVDFVTNLNTKTNRRKLVRALYEVPRTRLDLLPFYSRLVATLQPVMPDLGTELVQMMIAEFRRHVRKKNQLHIESKIRCMHFIGELVKFRVFPKSEALHCLRMLLFDFRHHNMDMACALLDSAGYFLFHSPDSHQKTKLLLDLMMRKRQQAAGMDQRYQMMIDNSFFSCNPPVGGGVQKIELPPLHDYINKLLYKDLVKASCERVLRQMRKVDWADEELSEYALKCLSAPWNVKYSSVQYLASVVAGLMWYHDWLGYAVVDRVLEDIRIGMEINHTRLNQRRVACMRFIGELYNYRVCDSSIVFKTLYSVITFGVSLDVNAPSPIDPPEHLFRIRLACVLLETCGEYFNTGSSKKKLDCYLSYLQRYVWFKRSLSCWSPERPFPLEAINLLDETLEKLRPKLKQYTSLDAAEAGIKQLEDEYREKVEEALKFVSTDGVAEEEEFADDEGLRPIAEEEEEPLEPSQQSQPSQDVDLSDGGGTSTEYDGTDDQEVHVHKEVARREQEDDDFLAAFDRMLADSIQSRVNEGVHAPTGELVVPPNARLRLERKTKFLEGEEEDEDEENEQPPTSSDLNFGDHPTPSVEKKQPKCMPMLLMTKGKSSKPTLKTVKVPVDDELVRSWRDRREVEDQEKQILKQRTLETYERMEAEEMQEAARNLNAVIRPARPAAGDRDHRQRFIHQKGAPGPAQLFSGQWSK